MEVEEKSIVFSSLWFDDMEIETTEAFQNSHLGGTDQESCSCWQKKTMTKKLMLRKGYWSTSSNLQPNYL